MPHPLVAINRYPKKVIMIQEFCVCKQLKLHSQMEAKGRIKNGTGCRNTQQTGYNPLWHLLH